MGKLIIANWKMQFSHNQACAWIATELPSIEKVLSTTKNTLVLCPSFTVLPFATSSHPTRAWGAQDCGFKKRGAFTGDISVLTLQELHVQYTLIGHSERRHYYGETDAQVAQKATLLINHGITPIICIGETAQQRSEKDTVLKEQIKLLLPLFKQSRHIPHIAYEPVWSIGTGQVPSQEELSQTLDLLHQLCEDLNPKFLYGGSVTDTLVQSFSPLVNGFLIGTASLDAQLLKKIILSC